MFASILAATDRITGHDPVVITAARLASALNAPWSILHALESASLSDRQRVLHFRTGEPQDATADYRAEVRRQIRLTYSDLLDWAPPCEIRIATGFPWTEISRQADRIAADLIVMGPHTGINDKHGALRVLGRIGSTVEGVITREHAPVMIINRHPCRPKPTFKHLLVGIDFSASCECALGFTAALARFYHAEVDLFHMLPVPPFPKYSRDDYEADREKTRDRMEAFGQRYLEGLPHTYHFWGGALPYREVFKCAGRCQPDAIVLGSHTKEAQGKWYAGSTVEKISVQATCPVFVVTDFQALSGGTQQKVPEERGASPSRNHTIHALGKRSVEKAH
jgi:nucleotide-binding universal stress UspA family protein